MGEISRNYWLCVGDALAAQDRGRPQDEGIKALQRNPLLHGGVVLDLGQGHGQARAGGLGSAEAAC